MTDKWDVKETVRKEVGYHYATQIDKFKKIYYTTFAKPHAEFLHILDFRSEVFLFRSLIGTQFNGSLCRLLNQLKTTIDTDC